MKIIYFLLIYIFVFATPMHIFAKDTMKDAVKDTAKDIAKDLTPDALRETIKINGGAAPIDNIFKKIEQPFETAYPKYDLIIEVAGGDVAIKELDQEKIDLAAAGLNPEDWKALSEKRNYPIDLKKIQFRVIGRDIIKVYLNPSLAKIKKLSNKELTEIFTGKITNWKAVGGPDQKIVLIFGTKIPGIYIFFHKNIIQSLEYAKGIDAEDGIDVQKVILKTKGAIGLGADTQLVPGLHLPYIEEFGRPVYSATKGAPSDKVRLLLEYIHKDGVKYIKNIKKK